MREIFVSELAKELLGPRFGYKEVLEDYPYGEYMVGVIVPKDSTEFSDDSEDIFIHEAESKFADDDPNLTDIDLPSFLDPVLNPKRRPSSFGISFIVETEKTPEIELCLTWGRYKKTEDYKWIRIPEFFSNSLSLSQNDNKPLYISNNQISEKSNATLSINKYIRQTMKNQYHITLQVVNELPFDIRTIAEHSIYQPELRINAMGITKIIPLSRNTLDRKKAIQYDSRKIYARGHLCSATWAELDPQKESKEENGISAPPFCWVDSKIVDNETREKFRIPEIRTDYLPIYSITQPLFEWEKRRENPIFSTEELAKTWDPDDLYVKLIPIYNEYKKWIEQVKNKLNCDEQEILQEEILSAELTNTRILKGIEELRKNQEARLAFSFANEVMNTQYSWFLNQRSRPIEPLCWRPYQLAYILLVIESLINSKSSDREICDLLWVPTGAGKTEAYLAIAAFCLAYRRRTIETDYNPGVGVISRYTLRLLSIQQYRRTLRMITACEYLRIQKRDDSSFGWLPNGFNSKEKYYWGNTRFSLGLWVGGGVTPNRLGDFSKTVPGAISILKEGILSHGEPAQIITCPACGEALSFASPLEIKEYHINWIVESNSDLSLNDNNLKDVQIKSIIIQGNSAVSINENIWNIHMAFKCTEKEDVTIIDGIWREIKSSYGNIKLLSVNPKKPGYFIKKFYNVQGREKQYDFEIFCTSVKCPLNKEWHELMPLSNINGEKYDITIDTKLVMINKSFQNNSKYYSKKIPIPAYTVDEQIYFRIPSMIISTVDKFARPAFEERAASLFGNVDHYHKIWGYYRVNQKEPSISSGLTHGHPSPINPDMIQPVSNLPVPDLIIQDELHLIEGPLGSMVGFYETAIDELSTENGKIIKYIASTATISNSENQIQNLFNRDTLLFPPIINDIDDRFFIYNRKNQNIMDDAIGGRLYMGIISPGRGSLTPIIRIWSRLLKTAFDNEETFQELIDPFWTLVGYFNAVRELGGAQALYWQDIPERMSALSDQRSRQLEEGSYQELSSRINSNELPAILELLEKTIPDAQDAVFTTSMFGTGIDISRFNLMVMHGQPKTTASYIQATGRVGRSSGAFIPVLYRSTRPRDLNHYEYFTGYHHQIDRSVEPVSVVPFTQSVFDIAAGPLCVYLLRNHKEMHSRWIKNEDAGNIETYRNNEDFKKIVEIFRRRAENQLFGVSSQDAVEEIEKTIQLWYTEALRLQNLRFYEYAISTHPRYSVVLGDPTHEYNDYVDVIFKNAPQSLRDLEETTGFQTEDF